MEPKKRIFMSLLILVVLVVAFYFITYNVTQLTGRVITGQVNDFEECLKKQNITLYIKNTDTDAELKKTSLVEYMQYFKIKNCINNNKPCEKNNINYFPTWIINNKNFAGDISVSELSEFTGCDNF